MRFFDHHLKGDWTPGRRSQPSGFSSWAPATATGPRRGACSTAASGGPRTSGRPAGTEPTRYYAHADGTLTNEPPTDGSSSTSYEYDPEDPVPTVGGNSSSYLTYEPREESVRAYPLGDRKLIDFAGRGAFDQREHDWVWGDGDGEPLADRDDVLVFRTPPLEASVTIAGPIRVRVFGSTDAADTDFTAKLIDEYPPSDDYPDGYALNLCDSICRARYRGYRDEPDFVEPGEVYEFYLEPYPTANVFKAGHRIRLDVSSSNFPRYDPNPNTGGPLFGDEETLVATNTVHHEADHPTHVELPIQPTIARFRHALPARDDTGMQDVPGPRSRRVR
ncbi:MAG: CocE/NonD family hydrolase [Halobacteriales archaeon]|nr:CocE/NonD family hydrolase [Halobacteriales archaeon]